MASTTHHPEDDKPRPPNVKVSHRDAKRAAGLHQRINTVLHAKQERLENILKSAREDKTCGPAFHDAIVAKINELNDQLAENVYHPKPI
eukprot:6935882-Pyramimonas_sp.AAC.1